MCIRDRNDLWVERVQQHRAQLCAVDLGAVVAIDEVWLTPARPVDFRDTPGFGFPVRFRVDASDDAKFVQGSMLVVDGGRLDRL